jgi:RNA polymerase sigma-70 factor (ECF subfamily)
MGQSDGEVIAASLVDGLRFAVIFDRHVDAVRRFVTRRLGASATDDVVSEAFRVAFERRAAFEPTAPSALPWLYGIAGNLVRRHHRDHSRWLSALARTHGRRDVAIDPLLDAADRVDAAGDRAALVDALVHLADHEREVLLLVAWEQLTPAEAADVLGIPAATARTRLHRARQHIRAVLAANGDQREVTSDAH